MDSSSSTYAPDLTESELDPDSRPACSNRLVLGLPKPQKCVK